jgi:hypothetical protein
VNGVVEGLDYTSYGQSESDVRPDRYKGLREDVRFTGNEDDVEVGLTAFAKRSYASALGGHRARRWASSNRLANAGSTKAGGVADRRPDAVMICSAPRSARPRRATRRVRRIEGRGKA